MLSAWFPILWILAPSLVNATLTAQDKGESTSAQDRVGVHGAMPRTLGIAGTVFQLLFGTSPEDHSPEVVVFEPETRGTKPNEEEEDGYKPETRKNKLRIHAPREGSDKRLFTPCEEVGCRNPVQELTDSDMEKISSSGPAKNIWIVAFYDHEDPNCLQGWHEDFMALASQDIYQEMTQVRFGALDCRSFDSCDPYSIIKYPTVKYFDMRKSVHDGDIRRPGLEIMSHDGVLPFMPLIAREEEKTLPDLRRGDSCIVRLASEGNRKPRCVPGLVCKSVDIDNMGVPGIFSPRGSCQPQDPCLKADIIEELKKKKAHKFTKIPYRCRVDGISPNSACKLECRSGFWIKEKGEARCGYDGKVSIKAPKCQVDVTWLCEVRIGSGCFTTNGGSWGDTVKSFTFDAHKRMLRQDIMSTFAGGSNINTIQVRSKRALLRPHGKNERPAGPYFNPSCRVTLEYGLAADAEELITDSGWHHELEVTPEIGFPLDLCEWHKEMSRNSNLVDKDLAICVGHGGTCEGLSSWRARKRTRDSGDESTLNPITRAPTSGPTIRAPTSEPTTREPTSEPTTI